MLDSMDSDSPTRMLAPLRRSEGTEVEAEAAGRPTRVFERGRDSASRLSVSGPCGLFYSLRSLVSGPKRRFKDDGFNLDLAYVTPRLIALGYPAQRTWVERVTRNHILEVHDFFSRRHSGHVKIFNLVAETNSAQYNVNMFRSTGIEVTQDFSFFDHSVPTFEILRKAVEEMYEWQQKDPENVVAIHCKAGKGRTGLMVCCFLIVAERSRFSTADECMDFYSSARMIRGEGLTVPSQRRWVKYFYQGPIRDCSVSLRLLSFKDGIFGESFESYRLRVWFLRGSCQSFESIVEEEVFKSPDVIPGQDGEVLFRMPLNGFVVEGAVRIVICGCSKQRWRQGPSCWLHAHYMQDLDFTLAAEQWDSYGCNIRNAKANRNWSVKISFEPLKMSFKKKLQIQS